MSEDRGRGRILIVDDDPLIRDCLAAALSDEGYETITAPHGAAALELLSHYPRFHRPPAVILLDMRMPVMDGWAFAEAYRRLPEPHAPIVVLTAAQDGAKGAIEIGAYAAVAKPFDLDGLLAVIDECLQRDDGTGGLLPTSADYLPCHARR